MLQLQWHSVTITTNQQAKDMLRLFREQQPKWGGFDTETSGLHIILDKPFIFAFGWIHPNLKEGYTFVVDIQRQPNLARQVIITWGQLAHTFEYYMAHNITFDLHMLRNGGYPEYTGDNLTDTMYWIRYGHDALTPTYGGPPLALKPYTARYITATAKGHEKLLDSEKTSIAKELNLKLKMRLSKCGTPPPQYKAKSYTIGVIKEIFSDSIFEIEDLPQDLKDAYLTWLNQDVPLIMRERIHGIVASDDIPYTILDRKNITKYAHYDIVLMLETFLSLKPVVEARENMEGIRIDNANILPFYEMESTGFRADKEYLEECRKKLKQYIIKQRQKLIEITGYDFKIGQNELILKILTEDFNLDITSTGKDELKLYKAKLIREDPENPAIKVISILQDLRTLEKWYSTYILRFQRDLVKTDRLYPTINPVGTVSGRITSDFQQFPKEPIKDEEGNELFHPRRIVLVDEAPFDYLVYLDYSQIELRFQAIYTILVGDLDRNLCRAYMPYDCTNSEGTKFDYNDYNHIQTYAKYDWFLNENPEQKWHPVDIHGLTTQIGTGLTPDHPDFKHYRNSIYKSVNFAKNYGATIKRLLEMFPEKSYEEVKKIDASYYTAFPGIKTYHAYCYDRAQSYAHTTNLFNVKYYGVSGHKLINLLVQGSAAYFLKKKIREVWDYMRVHNLRSKMQMQIHDELSWKTHNEELEHMKVIQNIMQDWSDTLVPVIAEMAITRTNWAEKQDV